MSHRDVSFCAWCEAKMPRWELADTDGEQGTRWFCTLVCLGEWVEDERAFRESLQEAKAAWRAGHPHKHSLEHALAEQSEEIAAKVREEEE